MRNYVVLIGTIVLSTVVMAGEGSTPLKPFSIGYGETIESEKATELDETYETESEVLLDNYDWQELEEFETALFVGDSRVVGMSSASGRYSYIGKVGAGYNWLVNEAEAELRKMLDEYPNMDVVLSFGVNDLGNLESYIEEYRKIEADYPNTRIWVMSVMPVLESAEQANGYSVKNSTVDDFNTRLQEEFSER